eukprot:PhM_4_TR10059/c4_g1_i5/m.42553
MADQQPLGDEAVEAFLLRVREANLCEVNVRVGWRPEGSEGAFTVQKGVAVCKTRSRDSVIVTLKSQDDDAPLPPELIKAKRFPFALYEFNVLEVIEGRRNVLVSDDEHEPDKEDDEEDAPVDVVLHDVKSWSRLLGAESGQIFPTLNRGRKHSE